MRHQDLHVHTLAYLGTSFDGLTSLIQEEVIESEDTDFACVSAAPIPFHDASRLHAVVTPTAILYVTCVTMLSHFLS